MFTYENGLILAFLIWIIGIVANIIQSNSMMQRNLKKIGKRIGFWGITDIDYSKQSPWYKGFKFFFIYILLPIPFLFLSWLYVGMVGLQYLYNLKKDMGAPQSIKEFRWRLRNIDLTFDELIKGLMVLEGQDLSDFDKVKSDYKEYLHNRKNG